ncbi:hypothetical protein [Streptomyces cyaneofuscatus]|uniref:hypothetical protein n=1 Tax=Streptomyces cyaneofuscatus TaxID=66883 RepID=UPI0037BB034A
MRHNTTASPRLQETPQGARWWPMPAVLPLPPLDTQLTRRLSRTRWIMLTGPLVDTSAGVP